jgi:hypothetical protein
VIQRIINHLLDEPEDLFDFDPNVKSVQNEIIIVRNFHSWLKNDLRIREQQLQKIIEKLERNEAITYMGRCIN